MSLCVCVRVCVSLCVSERMRVTGCLAYIYVHTLGKTRDVGVSATTGADGISTVCQLGNC